MDPITRSVIYRQQRTKESFFQWKSHWVSWSFYVSSVIGFSIGFLGCLGILLRVLSARFVFDSSPRPSFIFFLVCSSFFYQNMMLVFYLKTDVLFYIGFSKTSYHLAVTLIYFNNFNRTDSKNRGEILPWLKHKILCWKYLSSISQFINNLDFWIYSSCTLHKTLNETLHESD